MESNQTSEGFTFLNVGCGDLYFPEWNNCDLLPGRGVVAHNLNDKLPWVAGVFDAVYSSHVLEHLAPPAGKALVADMRRVLKPGGVCRIVVPDLEVICRLYLKYLEEAMDVNHTDAWHRYQWMLMELLDQMAREETGGELRRTQARGEYDESLARARFGDAYPNAPKLPVTLKGTRTDVREEPLTESLGGKLRRKLAKWRLKLRGNDPRATGEVHRWMYDRLSLPRLMEECGLEDCTVKAFDESAIPHWDKYNLDISRHGPFPRKPDSLYVEGRVPT